jgi:hypothetical protein
VNGLCACESDKASSCTLNFRQQAYDVGVVFVTVSPVLIMGFHAVVKCLGALPESQRINSLLVSVARLDLLVIGASCHLPDLDHHCVGCVRWERRLYQDGKVEVDHGQVIFTCVGVFAAHVLHDLSRSLQERILACGHVTDGRLQVFTASFFEVSLSWSLVASIADVVATVRLSAARAALAGRVIPFITIARHNSSALCCLRMLKQQIGVRFTVLSSKQQQLRTRHLSV